ncbi:ATP-dependent DNA ligase [Propionibacteriaceae bacterium Y1923]|uniref:ATP-dependent DNA ligase n=1 Tax=Aestuariimicrobium sp. Y1814 TaxID=3418742 RepID=UPI003C27F810
MQLPIDVPVAPMLARLVGEIPDTDSVPGGYLYEPKWDGFRCIVLRDGAQIELTSRMNKSLTSYFPEIVEYVRDSLPTRCVVDTEIFVPSGPMGAQHLDWDALSRRVHPSLRRVARMAEQTPAEMVAFDVLALFNTDLRPKPFTERRKVLEDLFTRADPAGGLHLTAQTSDAEVARGWYDSFEGSGLDGLMVKQADGAYEYGRRSWLKVKHARTAEAVVVGFRRNPRHRGVGSLILAMYGAGDESLHYVGVVNALTDQQRVEMAEELLPLQVALADAPILNGVPGTGSLTSQSLVALQPTRVMEVSFDQLEGSQFRHPAQFRRWRVDRDPRTCRLDQLSLDPTYDLASMLE